MKKIYLGLFLLLCCCTGIKPPDSFSYHEIQTDTYKLASWQKITNGKSPVRIYIEGDGYAFNHLGQPTTNPTPHGTFLRKIAFNDPNENVVYLARPCQYVQDKNCSSKDWTTARFSPEAVAATTQAVRELAKGKSVVLIGYSGGALLSGLVIDKNPKLPIKKWITLAGVLNHTKWTQDLNLPPLSDSLDLKKIPRVEQIHLIGDKDKIVSHQLTASLVNTKNLIVIPNATHDSGFEKFYPIIYDKLDGTGE